MTRHPIAGSRRWLAGALLGAAVGLPGQGALAGTWSTDTAVGPSQVQYGLHISCAAVSFVCDLLDGYSDVQTSTMSGSGQLEVDALADAVWFGTDGAQDVGAGAQPIYNLLTGSNMTFASIPFAGVPEITSLLVFATTDPPLDVVGLSLLQPGDYPLSGSVDYASLGDVVGDLELILPDIVVPPQTVMLSGTLRVLGDVDADDLVEYEVRDLTASLALQFPGLIGGENVDVDVVSTLTANLSGEAAAPILVPLLGGAGLWLLAGGLTLVGGRCAGRMRPQAR